MIRSKNEKAYIHDDGKEKRRRGEMKIREQGD
jgi:hypothetical protein